MGFSMGTFQSEGGKARGREELYSLRKNEERVTSNGGGGAADWGCIAQLPNPRQRYRLMGGAPRKKLEGREKPPFLLGSGSGQSTKGDRRVGPNGRLNEITGGSH